MCLVFEGWGCKRMPAGSDEGELSKVFKDLIVETRVKERDVLLFRGRRKKNVGIVLFYHYIPTRQFCLFICLPVCLLFMYGRFL